MDNLKRYIDYRGFPVAIPHKDLNEYGIIIWL